MSSRLRIVSVPCRSEGGRINSGPVDIYGLSHAIDRLAAEVEQHIDQILLGASVLSRVLHNGEANWTVSGSSNGLVWRCGTG